MGGVHPAAVVLVSLFLGGIALTTVPGLFFVAGRAVSRSARWVLYAPLRYQQARLTVKSSVPEPSPVLEFLARVPRACEAFFAVLVYGADDEIMSDDDDVPAPVSVVPRVEPIREPETQPVENPKPALDVGDIKDGGGLTANQRAEYEAVLRGEKTLTAETSGKVWARVFAVRPDRVYAERTRILALIESEQKEVAQDAAAESLAREVADPSIVVPKFTPPTLEHAA